MAAATPTYRARTEELALTLARWPSVTRSPDEVTFAPKLANLLRSMTALAKAGAVIELMPIAGDPLERANVVALLRGTGRETVLLSGHFDVVPVSDYGDLAAQAWDPPTLREKLIERLRKSGAFPQALADFESGAFLPGRGLLDMKSGLAAGLAVLEQFASDPQRRGNLLFIATPDEEDRSAGMRAIADALPAWLATRDLTPVLGINLDATCDNGDGSAGRTVALGCIGKVLLSAFVVGKDAHACYPLDGVNGAYLASELVAEMEFAPELGEELGHELASPPTVLGLTDLKGVYNVTTPSRVWAFWNVLSQRRSARETLHIAQDIAERAAARATARMRERASQLKNPPLIAHAWSQISVFTFADLKAKAEARSPEIMRAYVEEAERLARQADIDLPTRCRHLTEWMWDHSGLDGPAIVLGFASMPYPAIAPSISAELEAGIRAAAIEVAASHGVSIAVDQFLPVIVDMSFLGPVDTEDLRFTADQSPIWGSSIRWNLTDRASPAIPMLNVGPWGRDYHHWLERVHAPYAFETLPTLIETITRRALGMGGA